MFGQPARLACEGGACATWRSSNCCCRCMSCVCDAGDPRSSCRSRHCACVCMRVYACMRHARGCALIAVSSMIRRLSEEGTTPPDVWAFDIFDSFLTFSSFVSLVAQVVGRHATKHFLQRGMASEPVRRFACTCTPVELFAAQLG